MNVMKRRPKTAEEKLMQVVLQSCKAIVTTNHAVALLKSDAVHQAFLSKRRTSEITSINIIYQEHIIMS